MINHQAGAAAKLTSAWDRFWGGVYDLIYANSSYDPPVPGAVPGQETKQG